MRRIALAVFAAALTFLALSAPTSAGGCVNEARPTDGTSPDVRIVNCQFVSGVLRVPVGTTVTWTNADWLPHEVSGIGWGGVQRMLMPGETFSHEFTDAGAYPYSCPLHPGMAAIVLVGDTSAWKAPDAENRDPGWIATALLASLLVGVTGFAAGRYLGR